MDNPVTVLPNYNPLYCRVRLTGRVTSAVRTRACYLQNPIRDSLCPEDTGKGNDSVVKFPWSDSNIPTMFSHNVPPYPMPSKNLVREGLPEEDTSTVSSDCFFCKFIRVISAPLSPGP
jgi:hypothetical protein